MVRKATTHFVELTLVAFPCFGFAIHALAQSTASNVPNAPPATNEQRSALGGIVIHVNQAAYDAAAPKFAVLETSKQIPTLKRF